jgi:hypothetical protein
MKYFNFRTPCNCGRASSHRIWSIDLGEYVYYCCTCYVAAGNPPAESHPECIKAHNEIHQKESVVDQAPSPAEDFFAIPQEALDMKQYILDLAISCEARGAATVRAIGKDIVELLINKYGNQDNVLAIASLARVLVYVLDETEKRSMQKIFKMDQISTIQ